MPAIQLNVLRRYVAELADSFGDPDAFTIKFHAFLDQYANRSQRPGQSGEPRSLLDSFHVAKPVLRQVMVELAPLASRQPVDALALCDKLWQQPYLEFRLIATWLLGKIPAESPGPIIERLQFWVHETRDNQVLDQLIKDGLEYLSRYQHQDLLTLIETWVNAENGYDQKIGLKALQTLINTPGFENYPACFRLLQPRLRKVPADLRHELVEVVISLAAITPSETAFILRQNLELSDNQDTAWLIRQSIHAYPEREQRTLREDLRNLSHTRSR